MFANSRLDVMRRRANERDEARGFSVDKKRITIAYGAECVIIAASLYGAWLFAVTYGHNDSRTISMMMLAPIGYAVIEFCRVPLALSVRAHRSWFIKFLAIVGVICAAGVTIKSMSQLGEVMFRPRLFDVVHAAEELQHVKATQASLTQQIADADLMVQTRRTGLADVEDRAKSDAQQLASLPRPPPCVRLNAVNKQGVPYTYLKCPPADPRMNVLNENLGRTTASRAAASSELDKAVAARNALDRTQIDKIVATAAVGFREAVLHSQLHSFTAMVFGISPTEVTDDQISRFLRIFVFFPAIFVAFTSTLIAFTAVHRVKVTPKMIPFAPDGTDYLLNPLYQHVVDEAVQQVRKQHQTNADTLGVRS
jgi:hypothetical protein